MENKMYQKQQILNIFLLFVLTFFDFCLADQQQQQQQQNLIGDNNNEVMTTLNPLILNSSTSTTTTKDYQRIRPKWLIHLINSNNNNIATNFSHQHQHNQSLSLNLGDHLAKINDKYQQQQQQNSNSTRFNIFINHVILNKNNHNHNHSLNKSSIQINNDCIDGKTYHNYRTGHCHECLTKCPSGAIMLRPCNRTHNMECVCTQGWYMSILDGTCKPCSECPSGYGVWRTCRWSRNTVCRQCQPGTFSGVSVGTLGCIPCSKCGPNQEMISGCDGNRDTVCIDRSALMDSYLNTIDDGQQPSENDDSIIFNSNNGNNPIVGSSSLSSSSSSSTSNLDRIRNHTNGVHLLPLYISMLVVIVFTFCIYALIQLKCNNSLMLRVDHQRVTDSSSLHMHNHQTKLLPPHPPPYNANNNIFTSPIQTCPQHHQYSYNIPAWLSSQTTDISPYQSPSPHYHHSAMPLFSSALNKKESLQRKFHNTNNNNNNRSTPLTTNHYGPKIYNELLIGPTSPTSTTSTSIQSVPLISDDVEHLTIEIRQALENMLGKDTMIWRSLAKELGYDEKHIVQFEAKATTITNGLTVVDTFKAIRLLLLDWSSQMTTSPDDHHHQQQQQQSTETGNSGPPSLATLSNALIRIGRVDCARVIVRQNYQQQQR